jgi:cell division protein FtsI/penicillin-binding protein 2
MASTGTVFFVLFLVALARAFQLCVIEGKSFQELAYRQHQQRVPLLPERGAILDRRRDVLALSVESASIYARTAIWRRFWPEPST